MVVLRFGLTNAVLSQSYLPLRLSTRCYFWPYNEDFVPKGVTTSSFQSSALPSTRQRVLREYAFSPLFGAQPRCCTLGTPLSPRKTAVLKKEALRLLRGLLRGAPAAVTDGVVLGPLRHEGTAAPLTPRLDHHHVGALRSHAPRTLVDVFLPEETAPDEVAALGHFVRRQVMLALRVKSSKDGDIREGDAGAVNGDYYARMLVEQIGVVHCELPPIDEGGFVFDKVCGVDVTGDEAEKIVQRWHERGQ